MSKDWWILIISLVSMVMAQVVKFCINSIKYKKLSFKTLKSTGDFPSSHIAFISAMCMSILVLNNFIPNELFFATLILLILFIFDASGVRYQAKKHAIELNKINQELKRINPDYTFSELKEEIGHKWFEILGGLVLGIIIAILIGLLVIL